MMYLADLNNVIFNSLYAVTAYSPELNFWIYIIAEKLDWYVVLVGVFFILIHKHGHRMNKPLFIDRASFVEGLYTTGGVLLAWLLSYGIKTVLQTARPFIQFNDVTPLFLYGGYDSFPSGHATLFAALAIAIYLHHKKFGIIFMILAFMIGVARIIAGVHFPVDILGGWVLGGLCSWFAYVILIKKYQKQ
ncbi:phosphatase PAP2 family protein [Patescibacteria group bacterium]|nr:phosphatase PAP2 family protein [Patescibacteria group bacterium]